MSQERLSASLILVSRNGGERLSRCLEFISGIRSRYRFEIILVDNNSSDDSLRRMEAFARTSRPPCTVIRVDRPGNSAGRNDAVKRARGDVLTFIDDDCYVDPDFIDTWIETFADEQIGFATGSIRPYREGQSLLGCRVVEKRYKLQPGQFFGRGIIQGSNMAFSRKCLDAAGLFDERFGSGTPWAGEEWDLALRAAAVGFAGGLLPAPSVAHDHGRGADEAHARKIFYDYGAGAVYAKHSFGRTSNGFMRECIKDLKLMRREKERLLALAQGYVGYFIPAVRKT